MYTATRVEAASITECLTRDHQDLEVLLHRTHEAVRRGELAVARVCLAEFQGFLRYHLSIEEELVFPVVERTLHGAHRDMERLRRDHRAIDEHVSGMSAALVLGDLAAFAVQHLALVTLFAQHHERERQAMYPAIDRALDDVARRRIVEHLRVLL